MSLSYTSTDDVPLTGPDPYSPSEKQSALTAAEEKLEADINDGAGFTDDAVSDLHVQAISAWATYILASGPASPTSAQSGDFYNGSSADQAEFAAEMQNIYQSNKESLLSSDADAGSDSKDIIFSG